MINIAIPDSQVELFVETYSMCLEDIRNELNSDIADKEALDIKIESKASRLKDIEYVLKQLRGGVQDLEVIEGPFEEVAVKETRAPYQRHVVSIQDKQEPVVKRQPKNKIAKNIKEAMHVIADEKKKERAAPAVYSNRRSLYPELETPY